LKNLEHPKSDLHRFLSRTAFDSVRMIACVCALMVLANAQTSPRAHVAVLDLGESPTGTRASEKVREALLDRMAAANGIVLIDRNLATAAARGVGFQGSLNLATTEARDIGAAIGCDFFIIGEADTARRSPSTGAAYFESYASIFIVSARTGRLIFWERPLERRDTAEEAEQALLQTIGDINRYRVSILRALEDESAERASAVETTPTAIEVMSDDKGSSDARAPRPYRRLKPPYPDSAAVAEVEATVDVLVDIDAHGEIGHLEIARWAGYGLDQSVIDTVKQMHFFPAMRDGVAIPMRVLLRYNFRKPPK
jgi:TonB family protein